MSDAELAAWRIVGARIDGDLHIFPWGLPGAFASSRPAMSPGEVARVRAMVARALTACADAELHGVWRKNGAQVDFDRKSMRRAFELAHSAYGAAT